MLSELHNCHIKLPGLATVHSHAFQRALRGHCQRPSEDLGSFWSWRNAMYKLVEELTPDSVFHIARFAYAELAMAGVTAVGEFHYVHHQPGGHPYNDRCILSDAVIAAALDVGIRINLQRVVYQRAGWKQALASGQKRFLDHDLQHSFDDVHTLRNRYKDNALVTIGMAIHSVRAVSRPWIKEISTFTQKNKMPLHMHLSEQRAELEACKAEHGMTPVALMAEDGILDSNFVAVHATHLSKLEVHALGKAQAFVCICRTTERDLGDGHCDAKALLDSGSRICSGVDSHAISDPFEECRAIELDQRSCFEGRTLVADASTLLSMASEQGYAAIGMTGKEKEDKILLSTLAPSMTGFSAKRLDDAVVFTASPAAVHTVSVAGTPVVQDGKHLRLTEIRNGFLQAISKYHRALL